MWKFTTRRNIKSSPVVDIQGTVYFGGGDGILYALFQNGTVKWKNKLCNSSSYEVYRGFAIDESKIYFPCREEFFYAVYLSNGMKAWEFSFAGDLFGAPTIDPIDGTIYTHSFSSSKSALYAFDHSDGKIKNKCTTNKVTDSIALTELMDFNGGNTRRTTVVGASVNTPELFFVQYINCKVLLTVETDAAFSTGPAIFNDGNYHHAYAVSQKG